MHIPSLRFRTMTKKRSLKTFCSTASRFFHRHIYDDNGNVLTKSYGENTSITNTYDSNDQLLSANNDTYDYDDRGNITNKTVGDTTTTFTYSNSGWKDQLVSVNGVDLTYDANGNVLTYGDKEYTWNSRRNLESIVDGDNEYHYTYDENGIRTSKETDGVTTYFNTKDGVILSQTDGTNTWYFQYADIPKFKTILKRTNDSTIICCICALFGEFG